MIMPRLSSHCPLHIFNITKNKFKLICIWIILYCDAQFFFEFS